MIFDTHCHLHDEKLRDSGQELLQNAAASGVGGVCVICADPTNIAAFPEFPLSIPRPSQEFHVAYTMGLHPHEARFFNAELESEIRKKALGAHAIGETGLDYHYNFSEHDVQRSVFDFHIQLACELKKPLVIHLRDARQDVLKLLDREELRAHPNPGILHCFTEDEETAKRLLDMNFHISFSGILAFKNADALRSVARMVPLDRLLIETDSPYLAPPPYRGRSNQPAWVLRVLETLSEIREESLEVIREKLWQNSLSIYGLQ